MSTCDELSKASNVPITGITHTTHTSINRGLCGRMRSYLFATKRVSLKSSDSILAYMRHFLSGSRQERRKNIYPRLSLLVMLVSSHGLLFTPKYVAMFLVPTTRITPRIGMIYQRSLVSAMISTSHIQKHNKVMCHLRSQMQLSFSSTSREDREKSDASTTTESIRMDKSSPELDSVQVAREARKYVCNAVAAVVSLSSDFLLLILGRSAHY